MTINKLLKLIKENAHPSKIVELAQQMKRDVELSNREFQILMAIYNK